MALSVPRLTRSFSSGFIVFAGIITWFPSPVAGQTAETAPVQPVETTIPVPVTDTTAATTPPELPVEPPPSVADPAPVTTTPELPPAELPAAESTTTSTTVETTTTLEDQASEEKSRGGYSSQPAFIPDSVDPVKVEAARQGLVQANSELAEANELIKVREQSLTSINSQVDILAGETSELINQSADLRTDVHNMAVANFRNPSLGHDKPEIEDASEAIVYRRMVDFIATRNDDMANQFDLLNSQLTDEERRLVAETSELSGERDQAKVLYDQRVSAVNQAEIELATYEAAGEFFVPNAVFPVGPGVTTPLINSYGFDRARGTGDSHWHEGIDIFGSRGADLYAAEAGVITNVGSGRLGGLVVSLVGDSGTRWYYAHLDGFASGLTEGQVVQAGDLVGYLGDSGNARGTDPHLHLEIHPPDIRVVNPYPQLNVLLQQARVESEQNQIDGSASGQKVSIS